MKVYKQGIELEGFVIEEDKTPLVKDHSLHADMTDLFRNRIFHKYYFDDSKPEFPSNPYKSVGGLANHLSSVISGATDLAKEKGINYILIGCFPFWQDFASGHIHTSLVGMKEDTWKEMKRKLYNAQPMIALLSANSPLMKGVFKASDVRLSFSSWSRFTDFDRDTSDHYMALAMGEGGATLECRIPSSSSLYQILGIAVFIRILLEDEDTTLPIFYTREIFDRVTKYGSETLVPIGLPKGVTYHGVKLKKAHVRITDLWRLYYKENYDLFKEKLKDCNPRVREGVLKFYDLIANGLTVSDLVLDYWNSLRNKGDIVKTLQRLTEETYNYKSTIQDILPIPKRKYIPPLPKRITIEEFKDLIDHLQIRELTPVEVDDILKLIFSTRIRTYEMFNVISDISSQGYSNGRLHRDLLRELKSFDIVKEKRNPDRVILPGKNFPIFVQLLEESELFNQ